VRKFGDTGTTGARIETGQGSADAGYGFDNIWTVCHSVKVTRIVEIGDEFGPEFYDLHEDARTEILALTRLIQQMSVSTPTWTG
jgi:hypothetical protein